MSANTKKILIETESHEVFIVHAGGKSEVRGFCKGCSAETELLTLDEAVSHTGNAALEIMRRVNEGEIHFLETASGHLLICKNSFESQGHVP